MTSQTMDQEETRSSSALQLGGDPNWWRGGVIYQIYPRSFADSNGDGIGDLAGIASKIDYIASLGVDAIWISPFFVSPMKDFGYDVSDYAEVDPMFGTLEDFDKLLERAHAAGLRVLIDLVISHTSDQHRWFKESRQSADNARQDWYIWADAKSDGTPPNNWLSIFGGSAWEWDSRRRQYYLHNFLAAQPDLNFHNPAVQDAVLGVAQFWLERGVDGFRLDTVNFYVHDVELRDNPPAPPGTIIGGIPDSNPFARQLPIYNINRPENLLFLRRLRALTDSFPATTMIGEIGAATDDMRMPETYTSSRRLHMAYSFELLRDRSMASYIRSIGERAARDETDTWRTWALSNHDVPRAITRWGHSADARRAGPLLIAILTSFRGSPCLYQGEELALPEAIVPYEFLQDPYGIRFWPDFPGRDGCRTPMPWSHLLPHGGFSWDRPWLPVPEEHAVMAVSAQDADMQSPLNRTRVFLAWRRNMPALRVGKAAFIETPDPLLALVRHTNEERLLCLFNIAAASTRVTLQDLGIDTVEPVEGHGFHGRIDTDAIELNGYDAFFGHIPAHAKS